MICSYLLHQYDVIRILKLCTEERSEVVWNELLRSVLFVVQVMSDVRKAWFPCSRHRSLGVVDGLSQSLEYLDRWESLPVVDGLSGSLTVFQGR